MVNNLNVAEIKTKMESFINEISKYYNEHNIIDQVKHVLNVNENIDCNADHDFIRKKHNIPYDYFPSSRILLLQKLVKEYSQGIIDGEKHALVDYILKHIHSEKPESTDVQKIIEEGRLEVFTIGDMSCIIFCPRNIYDELKSKNSHDPSFKFIPSEKLSQQIVCVGDNAIMWTRYSSFALGTSDFTRYNSKYIQSAYNTAEFEIGTVMKCQIMDEKCIRVYNLQSIQH